jgi:benzodiazapine receptor
MKLNNPAKLIIAVLTPICAGLIGSIFTVQSIPTWYATLVKPELSPPNWIFGPAWTTLYILMGIAAFLVWKKEIKNKAVKTALIVFAGQLLLNTIWSIIFFGMQNPFWAFIDIIALWIAIVINIIFFYKVSRPAALLLLPYILWISFASYLNYSIWMLN